MPKIEADEMLHSTCNSAAVVNSNQLSSENTSKCAPSTNQRNDSSYDAINFSSIDHSSPAHSPNKSAKKTDIHDSFFNETLELSQEDIQKTLSANMPLTTGNSVAAGCVAEPIGQEINPMDFINNCCDEG